MTIEYENEACPEECSTQHDVPRRGTVTCPETGETWTWCDECTEWFMPDDYPNNVNISAPSWSTRITLCDPDAHGYVECSEHGCNTWMNTARDTVHEPCYNENPICASCWDAMGGCDCDRCQPRDHDEPDESEYDTGCEGEQVTICESCGEPDVNLDLLTEEFFCKCSMDAMLAVQPDHPFKQVVFA